MIKVINCKTKNYKKKLNSFLDNRRINKNVNTNIVIQILKDVKKNKYKALLKYETLTGAEIEDLINKNVFPANKEDLKAEEEEQGSALGSIGLKPKIVH